PFRVKGKAQPVDAAVVGTLVHKDTVERRAAPLVGRERELTVLLDGVEDASRGAGQVIELVGEPGLGKSRLVDEVRASASGLIVLAAAGEEYEASTPYHALRGMLRDLLGIAPSASPAAAARQLEARVASMAPQLLPWLPLLAIPLDLEVPSTPGTDRLGEKFRRAQLERVTGDFLGAIVSTRTPVVFEDLHWMDEVSHGLIRALVKGLA